MPVWFCILTFFVCHASFFSCQSSVPSMTKMAGWPGDGQKSMEIVEVIQWSAVLFKISSHGSLLLNPQGKAIAVNCSRVEMWQNSIDYLIKSSILSSIWQLSLKAADNCRYRWGMMRYIHYENITLWLLKFFPIF